LRNIAIDMNKSVGMSGKTPTTLKTTFWEYSNGAFKLATMESGQMNPKAKSYGVRYHWFRTKLKPNEIEVKNIAGVDQRADYLTKALRKDNFIVNGKLTCGW
jgi:hypothetical protein